MKSLKEFVEAKKLNEVWMPDSKLATWLKEYWNEIAKSERDSLIDVDKVIWDAEKELNIDLRKNKKELTDYLKRTWGKRVLKEATSNLREGFGELEVYTSFGPGLGIQIYPSRRGGGMAELTAHVGYVSKGSGNDTRKKELKSETEITAIDEIKVSDLKQIEKVVKKHLDALDSELEKTLKQLGYK